MNSANRLIFLAAALGILVSNFAAPAQKRMHGVAKPTPAVREIDVEGLKGLLKRENSRPLLINFWATWCDPCRDEFPDLVKIDTDYRPKKLDFIAISLDDLKDINTEVPKFLRVMNASMQVYLLNVADPEVAVNAVDPQWGGALPATFLYDAQGKITYKHFGRVNADELRLALDKLVGIKQ